MRAAFGAVLSAVCLVMSGAAADAADVAPVEALALTPAVTDGTLYHSEKQLRAGLRIGFDLVASGSTGGRGTAEGSRRFRLESSTVDYFPFDNGLRLSFGLHRDRLARLGTRGADFRGDRAFTGAFGSGIGMKRHLNPGIGVGYDQVFDKNTRLAFDGGFRMTRRDNGASQLVRLASASGDNGGLLGARSARFGPAARVSFIHKF